MNDAATYRGPPCGVLGIYPAWMHHPLLENRIVTSDVEARAAAALGFTFARVPKRDLLAEEYAEFSRHYPHLAARLKESR